ncbi:MAG: ADP-glyceromanno-heptose 6-epimerase [Bacteroidetes bacterium]|nr:ADP-glyceromanno-heptose 6-epimerase [Bacteroidota bacterium]
MKQLVVTGAAGFIGCNLARELNQKGFSNLILVDDFTARKEENLVGVFCSERIHRDSFIEWLTENHNEVEFIFHLGARTNTSEFNFRILDSLNLSYSKSLWEICTIKQIPLLYASSAATYGLGENGFNDNDATSKVLKPLNPYGLSKQLFDLFVLEQKTTPPFWCGLKFFNVYGPHEFHKQRMASVVLHAFKQISETGKVKLFKSHHPNFKDGEQLRDFIFVDDVVNVCLYFFEKQQDSLNGIYNLGTGKARTFNDLVSAIFSSLQLAPQVEYVPTPEDIRDKYQYFTEATMLKLRSAGYTRPFLSLEEGVKCYVDFLKNYNERVTNE